MAAPEPPTGAVHAYTMYGAPKEDTAFLLTTSMEGSSVAPATGGVEYQPPPPPPPPPDRAKKCRAKDDTCNGWRIHDSDFCAFHAGVHMKKGPSTVLPEGDPEEQ